MLCWAFNNGYNFERRRYWKGKKSWFVEPLEAYNLSLN